MRYCRLYSGIGKISDAVGYKRVIHHWAKEGGDKSQKTGLENRGI